MSLESVIPAAGRIAEIRSILGNQTRNHQTAGFGRHLDAAAAAPAAPIAVSVEESVSGGGIPTAALAALAEGATNAAPDIVRATDPVPTEPGPTEPDPTEVPVIDTSLLDPSNVVGSTEPYADLFNEAGRRHGVDPILLAAVAEVESGFDPAAVSSAGAGGLMQFMPGTADEMGVDRFDPASSVDGAARYLARDLERFGRLDFAIAAYNAGPGAVERYGGIPPFTETQNYVQRVLTAMEARR